MILGMGAFGGTEHWALQHHGIRRLHSTCQTCLVPRDAPTLRHNASGCPVLYSVPLTRASSVPSRHTAAVSYTAQAGIRIPRPDRTASQARTIKSFVSQHFTSRPSYESARGKKLNLWSSGLASYEVHQNQPTAIFKFGYLSCPRVNWAVNSIQTDRYRVLTTRQVSGTKTLSNLLPGRSAIAPNRLQGGSSKLPCLLGGLVAYLPTYNQPPIHLLRHLACQHHLTGQ